MRNYDGTGYLEQKALDVAPGRKECPAYNCTGDMDPMGELFYDHLGLSQGSPVVASPDITVGRFNNIQTVPLLELRSSRYPRPLPKHRSRPRV